MNPIYIIYIVAALLVFFSFIVNTSRDFGSKIVFKVMPFFMGIALVWAGTQLS